MLLYLHEWTETNSKNHRLQIKIYESNDTIGLYMKKKILCLSGKIRRNSYYIPLNVHGEF